MIRNLIILCISVLLFASCKSKKTIASKKDYSGYMKEGLVTGKVETINTEINFWQQKLAADTGSYVYMLELASNYFRLFRTNGNIDALQKGDDLLKQSSAKLNHTDPEILYSLSQNAISQHQFLQAASFSEDAENAKGDKYTIRLLEFDANMELGRYNEAYTSLESLKDKSAFDYLIRRAKWEDHKGNLDGAIVLMEQAFDKVKDKKKSLYSWALSNLSDMYGHAGRIEEAYNGYLSVLEKDPSNLYCLKGIAWIAYAHDNNTAEAKRILKYILSQTDMPDLKLVLAQIAETEGNEEEKKRLINEFVTTVTKPGYGNMYNKYLLEIYTEEFKDYDKAFAIADKELKNRFTPETCDWMAWVYYNKGDIAKAMEFSKSYVHKLTFEPGATMHTAFIYAANGKKEEAKMMLQECLESSFELGPVATKQIEEKLQTL